MYPASTQGAKAPVTPTPSPSLTAGATLGKPPDGKAPDSLPLIGLQLSLKKSLSQHTRDTL